MSELPTIDEKGEKPLYVSWSRLYSWETCHQQGWRKAKLKQGATVKDGRNFLHGTLADRAMRRWLEQQPPHLPGQMATYVDEAWDEHTGKDAEYKIKWRGDPIEDQAKIRELAKRVCTNMEGFLLKRVLPYDFEPELRFKVPIKIPDIDGVQRTIVLNGGIDIAVRNPANGQVWLYDLKATENERYVHGGIMAQLIFYSVAWTIMMSTPPGEMECAYLTPACKAQYHPLMIDSQDRKILMSRIVAYAQGIWQDDNKPVESNTPCWNCDVKHLCEKFFTSTAIQVDGKKRASISGAAKARKAVTTMEAK
jgi:hypothetical protein